MKRWLFAAVAALLPTVVGLKGDVLLVGTVYGAVLALFILLYAQAQDDIRYLRSWVDQRGGAK